MRKLLVGLLTALACIAAAERSTAFTCALTGGSLDVQLSPVFTYAFTASNNGLGWLTGGDVHTHLSGSWYSAAFNGTLALAGNETGSGVDPALGPFTQLNVSWITVPSPQRSEGQVEVQARSTAIITSFTCYAGVAVRFTTHFPGGATGAALTPFPPPAPLVHLNASTATSLRFPCFDASAGTALGSVLGVMEWYGDWGSWESRVGSGGLGNGTYLGGQASGPVLLFNSSALASGSGTKATAVVMSAAAGFRTVIWGYNPADGGGKRMVLGGGPHSYLDVYPPGVASDILLVSSDAGVAAAVALLGDSLQRMHGTSRPAAEDDPTTSKLSYFTDNGESAVISWDRRASIIFCRCLLLAELLGHQP
jgi:hypothetical protein